MFRLDRERHQKFGAGQVIDILLGKTTPKVDPVRPRRADRVRRRQAELTEAEWRGVVRQLLAQGLLAVEGDYGTLVLTEASARGAAQGASDPAAARPEPGGQGQAREVPRHRPAAAAELPEADAPVFEQLRAWRAAAAKEQGVPAYVIFHDATLREIAAQRPGVAGRARPGSTASARPSWPGTGSRSSTCCRHRATPGPGRDLPEARVTRGAWTPPDS